MPKSRAKRNPPKPEIVRRDGDLVTAFVNTANPKRKSLATYADLRVKWLRTG